MAVCCWRTGRLRGCCGICRFEFLPRISKPLASGVVGKVGMRMGFCRSTAIKKINSSHIIVAPVQAGAQWRSLHCRTLIQAIALRRTRPGLGPAAEILSLRRQRKNSKKGDPGVAAPTGCPFVQYKKWESPKTRYAQTSAFLFPFSVLHKWRLHMGTTKIKNNFNFKNNSNVNTTAA